jgi:hypothetical protein
MNKVDLTTSGQKGFALVLIIALLFLLKWLLPPMIFFLENLFYFGFLVGCVLLVIWNYSIIWMTFKTLSWNMTKWLISKDKLGYLYRYHDYIVEKTVKIYDNLKSVSAMRVTLERKINELELLVKNNKAKAIVAEDQGNTIATTSFSSKVAVDSKQIEVLKPRLEMVKRQEKALKEMYDMTSLQAEQLKYTLDSKAEEYKLLKEVDSATNSASSLIENNSTEYKIYQESLTQLESEVTTFIASIEAFEVKVKPIVAQMSTEKAINEAEGERLVKEFKAETATINFKK